VAIAGCFGELSVMASDVNLVLFCADGDRAAADRDLAELEMFGLRCALTAVDSEPSNAQWPIDTIGLVYLSPLVHGRTLRRLFAYLSQAGQAGQPLIAVVLDQGAMPGPSHQAPFSRVVMRNEASHSHFISVLGAAVLEELDRTGLSERLASDADETRWLPGCLVVNDGRKDHVIPTDYRGLVTVGRSSTCQICVVSTFASRLHGCLRYDGQQYLYRDTSRNGTLLYDGHEEVLVQDAEIELPEDAELRIGDVSLRLTRNRG
jgi:hypothetical protein